MSTERKFTQNVAIRISGKQQDQIKTQLQSLGYEVSSIYYDFGKYPYVTNNYGGITGYAGNNMSHQNKDLLVDNPELFLAIAAMSEGETFYPEEWVVLGSPKYMYKCAGMRGKDILLNGYGTSFSSHNYRKATVEELTNHFSHNTDTNKYINEEPKKEEIAPGDWVVATEEAVKSGHTAGIWQVEEVTAGHEHANSHLLLKNAGYSQKSYFKKATADDIHNMYAKEFGKNEPKPEPVEEKRFKHGDFIEANLSNGKAILGYYIEKSALGDWHYVQEKNSKQTYQCVSVFDIEMTKVTKDQLVEAYIALHGGYADQIQIV